VAVNAAISCRDFWRSAAGNTAMCWLWRSAAPQTIIDGLACMDSRIPARSDSRPAQATRTQERSLFPQTYSGIDREPIAIAASRPELEAEETARHFISRGGDVWRFFNTKKIQIGEHRRYIALFMAAPHVQRGFCPSSFPLCSTALRNRRRDWCNASDLPISCAWPLLIAPGVPVRHTKGAGVYPKSKQRQVYYVIYLM